jgi:hypothetical protein
LTIKAAVGIEAASFFATKRSESGRKDIANSPLDRPNYWHKKITLYNLKNYRG